MLSNRTGRDADQEVRNINFFAQHGVLPANTSTRFFTGVDYVFLRQGRVDVPSTCNTQDNVRSVIVPPGPCDLCAHARVLEHLGVAGPGAVSTQYSQVIMLNSGTRGPFNDASPDGAVWVDVASAAGSRKWAPHTVSSVLFSLERVPHPQSYFLSVPRFAFGVIFAVFNGTCRSATKLQCIASGEIQIAHFLFGHGIAVYSLAQRRLLHNFTEVAVMASEVIRAPVELHLQPKQEQVTAYMAAMKRQRTRFLNPTMMWTDPCAAVFVKFGGDVWERGKISAEVLRAVQRLTDFQNDKSPKLGPRSPVENALSCMTRQLFVND
jgi:hypothetical protein